MAATDTAASATQRIDDVAQQSADLLAAGAVTMSPGRADEAPALAGWLPGGTKVYVDHLPGYALERSLAALIALREAGLEPVPHLAARRIASQAELQTFLRRAVAEAGVNKALVLGGDATQAAGPYADAAALLRGPWLADAGLGEVGFAGYPEGHPSIATSRLDQALRDKLALAAAQGLGSYLVTQFSFAPARVVEYLSKLARDLPTLPVVVGMAGPTSPATLLRFAQRCGVSASLRAMGDQGMGAVRLFMHTDPAEQLSAVAQYCLRHASCNVVGAHLFSFGAASKSAAWMNKVIKAAGE